MQTELETTIVFELYDVYGGVVLSATPLTFDPDDSLENRINNYAYNYRPDFNGTIKVTKGNDIFRFDIMEGKVEPLAEAIVAQITETETEGN